MNKIALAVLLSAAGAARAAETEIKTDDQKTLYALGAVLASKITEFSLSPGEVGAVIEGFRDYALGRPPKADLQTYQPKIAPLQVARMTQKAAVEKKRSKAFLDKAGKEAGIVKTPSGLLYRELKPGQGASPKATDKVKAHYRGTLPDGREFDSSYGRGAPTEFSLNQVIKCWSEGLQRMKIGGKSRLICPSDLAYGDQGMPPVIPGGAALIFEVELVDIPKA